MNDTKINNNPISPSFMIRADCHDMAAFGITVNDSGIISMTGSREQVKAAIIEAMRGCVELFQSEDPMEDDKGKPTALLQARREHLGPQDARATDYSKEWRKDNDPVRIALIEGKQLFTKIASEIFLPDPPTQGVRNLPRSTFEGVEYFFDLAELANISGYDLRAIGDGGVEGESSERASELNRRAFNGGEGATGAKSADDAVNRKPPHKAGKMDDALENVQSQMGQQ